MPLVPPDPAVPPEPELAARAVSGNPLPPVPGRPVPGALAARRHLRAADPDLSRLLDRVGRCDLRVDPGREPVESLVRAIAHQQL
ncbi:MAG: hypothetical protein INR65_13955, partial [Gluconacetobacter diazotrophicus]|nr:hypothetical protein [Gluconacetobacter diazotrophicus]